MTVFYLFIYLMYSNAQCMNIIEDHEDEILKLFREKADDIGNELCKDETGERVQPSIPYLPFSSNSVQLCQGAFRETMHCLQL